MDPRERRTVTLYEMLTSCPEVRQAALSWPLVRKDAKRGPKLYSSWSRVSGLDYGEIERIAPMLLAHRVCLEDRTVDADAEKILGFLVAEAMRKKKSRT